MNDKYKEFFHDISLKVIDLVKTFEGKATVSVEKGLNDYSTEVDIAVENLIVSDLKRKFADHIVLAEEGHNDTDYGSGFVWLIDPICGTANLGRNINNFCTNIALANNGTLIAACVIDHSQNEYYWSVGDNEIYKNQSLLRLDTHIKDKKDTIIDVDFGAITESDDGKYSEYLNRYRKFIDDILTSTDLVITSLNTSLSFMYVAINKLDGYFNAKCKPWDICAASFLLQQSGGVITDLDGKPWTIGTSGSIGGRNAEIHSTILKLYLKTR